MATENPPKADFRSVLASVDSQGRRRWLYVHTMRGFWRRARGIVAAVLIAFYLAMPFVTVGGKPLLLIDLPGRHYVVAGFTFGPQDLWYLLLFLLLGIVLTLLTVALVGRFFCGWICPHNIFLEMVYRPLEALFEGQAHRRMKNDRVGGPQVWLRKAAKWAVWILITGALANTMTAVFVGTSDFRWGLIVDPIAHPSAIIFFVVFFSLTLFNFAWFREQTCTIVCPYGRLQSVMLDPHSLVVAYDPRRGEPRGKPGKIGTGDCVDCGLCVKVCPTGIDIRNGNQLECIHCAACVDACDSVMDKLARPRGLIGYRAESELAGGKRRILRPRTVLYGAVLIALFVTIAWSLATRETVTATLLRSGSMPAPFRDEAGVETVRQALPLALFNRSEAPITVTLALPPELGARLRLPQERIELLPGRRTELTPIVDVPRARFGDHDLRVMLQIHHDGDGRIELPVTLRRP